MIFASYPVGNLVDGSPCDARELPASVVLVVDVVGDVLEVLEVRPHQHVAQGDEVAVLQVLDLKKKETKQENTVRGIHSAMIIC